MGDGPAVLADQHQGAADHGLVAVAAGRAAAQFAADPHIGEVADGYRHAAAAGDHGVGEFVDGVDAGVGAHQIGFARALDIVRANREIGLLQALAQVFVGDAIGGELHRVRLDHILLHVAAQGIHVGHAGHGPQLRAHDPVLHGAQIGDLRDLVDQPFSVVGEEAAIRLPARLTVADRRAFAARMGELDGVVEDFPEARGDRAHLGLGAWRQVGPGPRQPLGDLLAHEVEVGVFLEDRRHLAEAVP